ncbi:MAG: glucose 1-dehydrogenase [Acidobacteria bacterium]|nr:glucose 1-dehydrogenase [Acidobacteriota bacterium]
MRLKDKVALVTGASSGIGKGIAIRFAAEGARVIINYRPNSPHDKAAAQALASSLADRAIAVAADVSQRIEVEQMMDAALAAFGRLDIAVCNAGICPEQPFLETTDDHWNQVLGVNLYGAFVVSQLAARQMVRQGEGGKIIFTSSVHEDIPYPRYTAYCASKGGLRLMMRNIALELAPHKINVNNIAPGAIATPMNQTVLDDPEEMEKALREIPWGRFGQPEEIAAVATFLASDDASYVTGSTYFVDGGLTHQVSAY